MKKSILSLSLLLFVLLSFAQTNKSIDDIFDGRREIFFRFAESDLQSNSETSISIVIDKIENSFVYAYANKSQFKDFLELNISYEKLTAPSMLLSPEELNMMDWASLNAKATTAWDYYPTYSAYVALMQQFESTYPSLCNLDTIGTSVDGRLLLVLKISDNVNTDEDEPEFFYTSTMHGDETAGYVLMLHLIDYLLINYGIDTRVTNMVNNIEIYINPLANPDGTYAGGNTTVSGATRSNANGRDLNRNFPVPNGNIGDDGTFTQEVETQDMITFSEEHDIVLSANYHGGAELLNYPWDYTTTNHADKSWWIYVSEEYADTAHTNSPSGYLDDSPPGADSPGVIEGATWYSVDGSRQDQMQYFAHCREVTIELSTTKNPAASTLEPYWNYNYRSFLNYMEQCLYGIRGIITDSCTGLPIKALISISSHDVDSSQVYSSLPVGNYHRPIGAGTWTMTVSALGYQSKTISGLTTVDKSTIVQNVTLVADPPSANFIADNLSSCTGIINFYNTSVYSQGTTFLWDFGDGNTSTLDNPTHTYSSNGTFSVKLSVYACAGSDSITKTSYITINMPAAPIATNDSICGSGSMTLTASGGIGTLQWYDAYPGGNLLGSGMTYNTPVLSSTTTYYVLSEVGTAYTGAKPDNGGTGGYYTNSSQHGLLFDCTVPVRLTSVKMYANSSGNRTITLLDNTGSTIDQVTVNVPSGESIVILNLDIPVGTNMRLMGPASPDLYRNGSTIGPDLFPFTVGTMINITKSTASSAYKYYYYFYNWTVEEICQSSATAVTAEVLSEALASFIYNVGGSIVDFTNTGTSAAVYHWDFGDGNTSTLENPSHTYAGSGTYVVSLIVNNISCSDTVNNSVVIGLAPYANFIADTVCLGAAMQFQDLSSISSGSITGWEWEFGDAIGTSSVQNPTYIYADTGAYQVELIVESDGGAFDTTLATVYVTTRPYTDFSYIAGFAGASTDFTDLSQSYILPLISWTWSFGDGNISSLQNPSNTYINPALYGVTFVSSNLCGSDTAIQQINIVTTAIGEIANSISLYPNPSSGQVMNLSFFAQNVGEWAYYIYSLDGRLIDAKKGTCEAGPNIRQINIMELSNGVYWLELKLENNSYRIQFVK